VSIPIYQVDSFTDRAFHGNPAGVCFPPDPRDEAWMQAVAKEMNLSETAFIRPEADGYGLRWFTPAVEVDLCGHATLATAHVLWESGRLELGRQARFHTRSGLLTAEQRGPEIELDFPASVTEPTTLLPWLGEALGVEPLYIGKTRFDYLVEVGSEEIVRGLRPDVSRLKALSVRGVIVTSAAAAPGYDFVSRFFAPGAGIDEDPVTGSAHCALGPFWGDRLGKKEMIAFQASERGGTIRVRLDGSRVRLGGQAVTVIRGELAVS
jgi:PhzF family phenazine biosynthesis protein